jgi:hypothetical protein
MPVSKHGLTMDVNVFATLMTELAHRGGGVCESGAFLLRAVEGNPVGDSVTDWVYVTALAFYDDLAPDCLTGGITFGANGYSALAAVCRRDRVRVVGDIHTHPRDWVGQSLTDAAHPMSALPGHIALIAPGFAQGDVTANDLGVHVYTGGQWTSYYGSEVDAVLRITGGASLHRAQRWLRHLVRWLWRLLTPRRSR